MKKYTKKALEKAIGEYFAWCDSHNEKTVAKPYTLSGLCLHLGLTRGELDALRMNNCTENIVEMARLRIETATEEQVLTGKLACNPSLGSLKYNFGWNDKPKQETPPGEVVVKMEAGAEELSS